MIGSVPAAPIFTIATSVANPPLLSNGNTKPRFDGIIIGLTASESCRPTLWLLNTADAVKLLVLPTEASSVAQPVATEKASPDVSNKPEPFAGRSKDTPVVGPIPRIGSVKPDPESDQKLTEIR